MKSKLNHKQKKSFKRNKRNKSNKKSNKSIKNKKFSKKTKKIFIGGEEPTPEEKTFIEEYVALLESLNNINLNLLLEDSDIDELIQNEKLEIKEFIAAKIRKYNQYSVTLEPVIENRKKKVEDEINLLQKYNSKLIETDEKSVAYQKLQKLIYIKKEEIIQLTSECSDLILPKEEIAYELMQLFGTFDKIYQDLHSILEKNKNFLHKYLFYDSNRQIKYTAFLYTLTYLEREFMKFSVMRIFNVVDNTTMNDVNNDDQNAIFIEINKQGLGSHETIGHLIDLGVDINKKGKITILNFHDNKSIQCIIPPLILAMIATNIMYRKIERKNGYGIFLDNRYSNNKGCIYILLKSNANISDEFLYDDKLYTPLEFVFTHINDPIIVIMLLIHMKIQNKTFKLLSDEKLIDKNFLNNKEYTSIKNEYNILKKNQDKIKAKDSLQMEKHAQDMIAHLLIQEENVEKEKRIKKDKKTKLLQSSLKPTQSTPPQSTPPQSTPSQSTPSQSRPIQNPAKIEQTPIQIPNPDLDYEKLLNEDYEKIFKDSQYVVEAMNFFRNYTTDESLYKFKESLQLESTKDLNFMLFTLFEKCIGFLSKLFKENDVCILLIKGSEATRKILRIETTHENYTDLDIMIIPLNTIPLKNIAQYVAIYIKYVVSSISNQEISYFLPDNYNIVKISSRINGKFRAILDIDYNYNGISTYIKDLYSDMVIKKELGTFELWYICLNLYSILKEKMYYIVKYTNYPFLLQAVNNCQPGRNDQNVFYLNKTSLQLNNILEIMIKDRNETIKKKPKLKPLKKDEILYRYWSEVFEANYTENPQIYVPDPYMIEHYISRNTVIDNFVMTYPDTRFSIIIPKN